MGQSDFPILRALARLYSESKAGRTGAGQRDFLVDFKKLLAAAGCEDGDSREVAIRQLKQQDGKIVRLEGPRRDADITHQVRLPQGNVASLFALLDERSPAERREQLSRQFTHAMRAEIPQIWREGWEKYCVALEQAALRGETIAPFSRDDFEGNTELLSLIPKLLAWHAKRDESLLRFASCVLTGNSKRLGELAVEDPAGSRRGKLGAILDAVTSGKIRSLEDVGILKAPRFALVQGPLRLLLDGEWLDIGKLHGPCRLSEVDVARATIETAARRCLTIENETSFHELAKLRSGELLICTSYPGSATVELLKKLPASVECWHFGDSDPEGFDILRDLRQRTGRPFCALHMDWRPEEDSAKLESADRRLIEKLLALPIMSSERPTLAAMLDNGLKGRFEQESLGPPNNSGWPFYS